MPSKDRGVLARRWLVGAAVAVVAVMAVVLWSPLPPPVRALISDWGVIAVIAATAATLWWRSRATAPSRRRQAWQLFTIAALLAALGSLVLLLPQTVVTGPAVVLVTVSALLTSAAGAVLFPSITLGGAELGRVVADGLVVGLSLLGILSSLVLTVQPDRTSEHDWGLLVLPVADCLVVTLLIIMVLRSPQADYARFYTAALGFICIGVADTGLVLRELTTGVAVTGEPSDLGWFVGYLSIAVAVVGPDLPSQGERTVGADRPLLATSTVYLCLVVATVVVMVGPLQGIAAPLRVLAVLAVIAVGLRELLVTYDNQRLRRGLSQQVERRTEQLRESGEVAEAVAASVGDGILAADLEGRLTYVNAAAVSLLERTRRQLVGGPMAEVVELGAERGSTTSSRGDWVVEAVVHGRVSTGRTHCRQQDGSLVPVQLTVSPLHRHGRTAGCVVVFRDLREQERVERLKSEFVSTVSHELRTPLTSIRGVLGLMTEGRLGPLAPQAVPMVRIAADSSERLSRLVDDLLDVERLESGQLTISTAEVDLTELVQGTVEQSRLLFSRQDVTVRLHAAPDLPLVHGDRDRIQQVVTNLLSNAAKYAPAGSEVAVGLVGEAGGLQGEDCLAVSVTDTGPGIPADKLGIIFDRFVQADQSDTRAKEGTGLGLAIARQLVRAMRGSLEVASDPGRQTTFTMRLPAVRQGTAGDRALEEDDLSTRPR